MTCAALAMRGTDLVNKIMNLRGNYVPKTETLRAESFIWGLSFIVFLDLSRVPAVNSPRTRKIGISRMQNSRIAWKHFPRGEMGESMFLSQNLECHCQESKIQVKRTFAGSWPASSAEHELLIKKNNWWAQLSWQMRLFLWDWDASSLKMWNDRQWWIRYLGLLWKLRLVSLAEESWATVPVSSRLLRIA